MQKLSWKNIDKLYKSCSVFNMESNKVEFAFFWILYNFLWIFKVSGESKHYLRSNLHAGPYNFPCLHKYTPTSQKRPCKYWGPCNAALGHGQRRLGRNSGEGPAKFGWGRGQREGGAHPRSISGRRLAQNGLGDGARRYPAAMATGARAPARRRCVLSNTRHEEVL
jgi:hypothetical protein